MKLKFTIGIVIFSAFSLKAQDVHLSQIIFSSQTINPAAYGNHDGWERFGVHQKNQNLSTGKYSTSLFYFDAPMIKSNLQMAKAHVGLGLQAYNDVSGNGSVVNRAVKMGISTILPVTRTSIISFGAEGGIMQQSVNTSKLTFGNQFDGNDFNPTYLNYEGLRFPTNVVNPEVAAGLMYRFKNYDRVLMKQRDFWFQTGVSAYHLLTTKKAISQYDLMMPRKYVFHAEMENMITNGLMLNVKFNQYLQQKQYQSIITAIVTTQLNDHSQRLTSNKPMRFGGGISYRYKDAVIPVVVFEWNEFILMGSSDIRTNKKLNTLFGGFEFSIKFSRGNHALNSKSIFGGGRSRGAGN